MRLSGPRRGSFPAHMVAAVAVAGLLSLTVTLFVAGAPRASASAPLTVTVDHVLSAVTGPVNLSVDGAVSASLRGAELTVSVKGPVPLDSVGQMDIEAPEVTGMVLTLGTVSADGDEASTEDPAGGASTTTSTSAPVGVDADLERGVLDVEVALPPVAADAAGAYLLRVSVRSGDEIIAGGEVWIGRLADRETPLAVVFVLPLSLGIHRGPNGAFFDQVLERAVMPAAGDMGGLSAVPALLSSFPDWHVTLAVEPVLLTQLEDMANGYTGVDPAGNGVEVGSDGPAASGASAVLSGLRELAARGSVQMLVSPYAGADLDIMATEGWRDGLEQVLLGRQELQQVLGVSGTMTGAFSPGLDLTSAGMSYYASASIDHVVVRSSLVEELAEPVPAGTVAVRVVNAENDRATLVLAPDDLHAFMTGERSPDLFGAALAAELSADPRDAVVIVPDTGFEVMSASALESIGRALAGNEWIDTQTVAEVLRAYPPGTRPALFETASVTPQGYIEESFWAGLRSAHAAVSDLAEVADSAKLSVETAYRLLFLAESRWWYREQVSPREANIGLEYATQAQAVARGELEKVGFVGAESTTITGGDGTVHLIVENGAEFPVTVLLQLNGDGVTFPDGGQTEVELEPGRTILPVNVAKSDGAHVISAELVAGESVLGALSQPVRFIGLMTVLPWMILGALILAGVAYVVVRRLVRTRRAAAKTGKV